MKYYPELLNIYKITLDEYDKRSPIPEGKMLILPFPAKEIRALVNEIDRLQKLHEWIPVEEKLPDVKKDTLVLCVTYYKHSDQNMIDTRTFWADSQLFSGAGEVTYWQPLPQPPEEK
jgi:hypothetical protein